MLGMFAPSTYAYNNDALRKRGSLSPFLIYIYIYIFLVNISYHSVEESILICINVLFVYLFD